MTENTQKPYEMLTDKVTGLSVPNVGAEANRQEVEQVLMEIKGYAPGDIAVDTPVAIEANGISYHSALDLVVSVEGKPVMVIKCAAASLGSREREVLAAARVCLETAPPLAAASDGRDWLVWDVNTGKAVGQGLEAVPSRNKALEILSRYVPRQLPEKILARERIIFRSYDMDNVNVVRKA
ncbi:MAG: type I restriction enzyme HsdR N-terminal domain-containing protein [Desulfatibacillum sp.]|nr:type I restriction enzyme HsdR N-terminal domain-containing protein [Desulfatibacillum sp.]